MSTDSFVANKIQIRILSDPSDNDMIGRKQ